MPAVISTSCTSATTAPGPKRELKRNAMYARIASVAMPSAVEAVAAQVVADLRPT
jgi:hypothetical protein